MNSHHKQQTDLPYECLIENHIEHLMSEYDRLSTDDACPQLWLLSATLHTFSRQARGPRSNSDSPLLRLFRAILCPYASKADEQFRT